MPVAQEKRYGYRKGRYAVEKHDEWTHKYKKFNVINVETGDIVIECEPSWEEACRKCDEFANWVETLQPSPALPTTKPKEDDDLPKVRIMGDPF